MSGISQDVFKKLLEIVEPQKAQNLEGKSSGFKVQITFCVESHLYFKRYGAKFEEIIRNRRTTKSTKFR